MALVLHGAIHSTCTRRVVTTLLEKGVEDWRLEPVNLAKGEQKSPEFLAKQPFGVVPVLEDGDLTLFESRAIARYIAEKYGGQGGDLLGSTLKERAIVNQWLEVESQDYNPPIQTIIVQKVFLPRKGLTGDEAKVAEALTKANKVLDVYEKHLEAREYLAGNIFSLADLVHLPYTSMLWPAGHSDLITSRPNVSKWWERISTRPSWQKIVNELTPK